VPIIGPPQQHKHDKNNKNRILNETKTTNKATVRKQQHKEVPGKKKKTLMKRRYVDWRILRTKAESVK